MRSLTHSVKWGLELLCHLPRGPWADSSLFLATSDSCPGFQPVCPPPWPPGLGQMALTLCTSPLCPTRPRGPWEGADCLSQLSWYPNPCHNTQCTIEGCSPPSPAPGQNSVAMDTEGRDLHSHLALPAQGWKHHQNRPAPPSGLSQPSSHPPVSLSLLSVPSHLLQGQLPDCPFLLRLHAQGSSLPQEDAMVSPLSPPCFFLKK